MQDVSVESPGEGPAGAAAPGEEAQQQRGPQRLLMMLLGDYWFDRSEAIPSAALVALLADFGVSEVGARAALSRQARRGLLDVDKQGRRTYYRLSPRSVEHFTETGARIAAFGAEAPGRRWDGQWSLVAFSVPEQQRSVRHALREQLRWLGYAPLYDGVWISPHANEREVREALDELHITTATVFRAQESALPQGGTGALGAWDLDEHREAVEAFAETWSVWDRRAGSGDVAPADALRARTELITQWRTLMTRDPQLPRELLPDRWPLARARAVFVSVYDALGPLAEFRMRQLIAVHDEELAALAMHHTVTDLAGL
ncbi:PaaX family transcriptional regulator C-terminal domain-containing protein [Streptomyces sp. NPDC005480]|uniref:PaaX family transcriptional regulator n=1 Tax=Streptomyces sp. NPDC005480 TaxID=3154880 RepID=UPI0033BDAD90